MFHRVQTGCCPSELGLSVELLPGNQQLFLEQLESPELPTNWVTACKQTKGGCCSSSSTLGLSLSLCRKSCVESILSALKKSLPGHFPVVLYPWLSL